MTEEPIQAVITSRFDLGFIVKLPNGQFGQLHVPEMSKSTAEWDQSLEEHAGIGNIVDIYVVCVNGNACLLSEFSAEARATRDQKQEDWIKAQEQAKIGYALNVRVERKHEWGCICRQEVEPFLEGVIPTLETVTRNQLPSQCAVNPSDWDQLAEGATVDVTVSHKQWANWRYIVYFSIHQPFASEYLLGGVY